MESKTAQKPRLIPESEIVEICDGKQAHESYFKEEDRGREEKQGGIDPLTFESGTRILPAHTLSMAE